MRRNHNVHVEPSGARVVDVLAVLRSPKGRRTLEAVARMRRRIEGWGD